MSKQSEDRLLACLEKVADYVGEGLHPTDALVKAAEELEVPAGHIPRAAAAYNNGRSAVQRQASDDVWEKAASFPLADGAEAVRRLYPDAEKLASVEVPVAEDYKISPLGWVKRAEAARKHEWACADGVTPMTKAAADVATLERAVAAQPGLGKGGPPQPPGLNAPGAGKGIAPGAPPPGLHPEWQGDQSYLKNRGVTGQLEDLGLGGGFNSGGYSNAAPVGASQFKPGPPAPVPAAPLGAAKPAPVPPPGKTAAAQTDPMRALIVKQSEVHRLRIDADEARRRAAHARDLAEETFRKLAEELRTYGAPSFSEFKQRTTLKYGKKVAALLTHLEEEEPVLAKQASRPYALTPMRGPVYELLDRCLEAKDAHEKLRQVWEVKEARAVQAKEEFTPARQEKVELHPILGTRVEKQAAELPPQEPQTPGLFDSWDHVKYKPAEKAAGLTFMDAVKGTGGALSSLGGGILSGSKGPALHVAKKFDMLDDDPSEGGAGLDGLKADRSMEALHRRSQVQDLLSNDDMASGHDPHDVLNAYKEIQQVAPLSASKPAIVRDFVRRRLAGGSLSYFDLEALSRIEKNLSSVGKHGDPAR